MSQSSVQIEDRLIDPRSTRLSRLQAARRIEDQKTLSNEGILHTVPLVRDEQGLLTNGDCVEPIAFANEPKFFPNSLSISPPNILESQSSGVVQNLLEIGAVVDDALYISSVNDVACTTNKCNKRISVLGQEWLAGRPGNRPIGARSVARNCKTYLGPYATRTLVQPHTGHNTRVSNEASSRIPQPEDQDIASQPRASSLGRLVASKDRASLAMVALHLCRLPYFTGGADDDVHVWASIVDRWLRAVQGEPSTQLTYVVSLLRGATFEWFSSMETHTGCPSNWRTLRHAMLERFGLFIRAKKAHAALLQMTQDKMIVLEYFDAFESYLAQLEDCDESFFMTKFIFRLRPSILTQVFMPHPATLLETKGIAEDLKLTQSMVKAHQSEKKTTKVDRHRDTQERRSGRLF